MGFQDRDMRSSSVVDARGEEEHSALVGNHNSNSAELVKMDCRKRTAVDRLTSSSRCCHDRSNPDLHKVETCWKQACWKRK